MKGLTWSPTPSVQGPCAPPQGKDWPVSRARKGDRAGAAPGGALRTAVPAGCHPGSCPRQGPRLPGTPPKALAKAKPRRELPARPPSSFLCPPRLPAEACPTPSPSARVARGVVGLRLCTNVHPSTWTERHACVRTSHHTVTEPDPGRSPGLHKPGNRTGPGHETPPRRPAPGGRAGHPRALPGGQVPFRCPRPGRRAGPGQAGSGAAPS